MALDGPSRRKSHSHTQLPNVIVPPRSNVTEANIYHMSYTRQAYLSLNIYIYIYRENCLLFPIQGGAIGKKMARMFHVFLFFLLSFSTPQLFGRLSEKRKKKDGAAPIPNFDKLYFFRPSPTFSSSSPHFSFIF